MRTGARVCVVTPNTVRITHGPDGYVYVETTGKHDGTMVATTVKMERAAFASLVRELGVM